MRIVNMSFVIVGAIVCLSTVSFSGTKMSDETMPDIVSDQSFMPTSSYGIKFSGGTDFRWKSTVGTTSNSEKKNGDAGSKDAGSKDAGSKDAGSKDAGSKDRAKRSVQNDSGKQINGLTRSRMDLKAEISSQDGKGKAYFAIRYDGVNKEDTTIATYDDSTIRATKAYVDYIFGPVTMGIGPKIGFPGSFSDTTVAGIVLKKDVHFKIADFKIADFKIAVATTDRATGNEESQEKSIITANGSLLSIVNTKFDYRLGADKEDYLATSAHISIVEGFDVTAGYASGLGDNNKNKSIMGVDTKVAMGPVVAYGAFSMSGKEGGKVTENSGFDGRAMGDIRKSRDNEAIAMQFGAKLDISDIAIQGYWSNSNPSFEGEGKAPGYSRIYIDATYEVNQMASANIRYYIDGDSRKVNDKDTESLHTVEIRLTSTF